MCSFILPVPLSVPISHFRLNALIIKASVTAVRTSRIESNHKSILFSQRTAGDPFCVVAGFRFPFRFLCIRVICSLSLDDLLIVL